MDNCFSSSIETITQTHNITGDKSRKDNSNDASIPVVASSGTGSFSDGAHHLCVAHSQFVDVHGSYIVCGYYAGMEISESIIMITLSKSTILQLSLVK